MQVSHESPIELLNESITYNDYDYCLVHLLDQEPLYRDFFLSSKKLGRKILLDNSIFELGKSFESAPFAEWISKLQNNNDGVED